jgi:hypothetical protein
MQELLLLVGLTGITMIIVRATIFDGFRERLLAKRPADIGYLFTCCQCMGFWIGLFGGLVYAGVWFAPLYAGAVSVLAMLADKWMLWMGVPPQYDRMKRIY